MRTAFLRPSAFLTIREWLRAAPIRVKFTAALTALMACIAVFFFLYVPARMERQALEAAGLRAQTIAQMTAFSSAVGLYFDDPASVEEALDVARRNQDLAYLTVYDKEGLRVAAYGSSDDPAAAASQTNRFPADNLFRVVLPIYPPTDDAGEVIGTLHLGLSLTEMREHAAAIRATVAWVSLLLFVLGMLGVSMVSAAITRPLGRITSAVDGFAGGDFQRRADVQGSDEVGQLATAFNDMASHLQTAYERLEALNADLVTAKEHAEEMVKLKSAFLANMSHEIRTPLTAIIGFAELLSDEVDDDHRDFAEMIQTGGTRLLATLNSVLDLSRLQSDRMPFTYQTLDVGAEVESSVQALAPLAQRKGVGLVTTAVPGVFAHLDRDALTRIVNNLVGNAIKFTGQGEVRVRVYPLPQGAALEVADTGVGMDAAFLDHLFEEFVQESSGHARTHEGSGLGLAITKHMVAEMGGEIRVESEKGQGSVFTVLFPSVQENEEALRARADSPAGVRVAAPAVA